MTPLIHWDFSGKSNADAGTIVEDLTGNGYDLELKNFAFDNKSGYNGYPTDFRKWDKVETSIYDSSIVNTYENKIVFDGTIGESYSRAGILLPYQNLSVLGSLETLLIKVSGLKENQQLRVINQTPVPNIFVNIGNGISFVDVKNYNNPDAEYPAVYIVYNSDLNNGDKTLNNVTVEIFPLYPDQLVFNGNNNFCQCTKDFILPNSRGYTWITKYKRLENSVFLVGKGVDSLHNILTVIRASAVEGNAYSYSAMTMITANIFNKNIIYGTSKFIEDFNIAKGAQEDTIDNKLVLGTIRPTENLRFFNGTMSEFYLFDRDLTQSQIEKFISDNMVPLPEVYYDVAKQGTSNEHTTKDKLIDFSGNQHHGTLHNFTFDESNGWGYYPLDYLEYDNQTKSPGFTTLDKYKFTYKGCESKYCYYSYRNITGEHFTPGITVPSFRIKITGLDKVKEEFPNGKVIVQATFLDEKNHGSDVSDTHTFHSDGIYTIASYQPKTTMDIEKLTTVRLVDFFFYFIGPTENTITVELLPTDEDCLRFNNTSQTYVDIDTLTKGFKTIFMVFNPAAMGQVIYDQRNPEALNAGRNKFAIFGENNSIAWNARNKEGVTYINGELNTTKLSSSLIGQKHCATLVNDTIEDGNTTTPNIGRRINQGIYYADMKFYKFLGFKEALSEKQIKMIIEKYKLQIN